MGAAAALAWSGAALAQHATANAVAESDDAFGTNIGIESTGIYTENDTRGFSPTKAGNVRIDGIYFDPVAITAGRLRDRTAIRVGFAAEDYPFHAPTGIVDHKFRPMPEKLGASAAWHQQAYGSYISELDLRVPLAGGHVGLTGGLAFSRQVQADGSGNHGYGYTLRPIIRFGGVELAPFASVGGFHKVRPRPLLLTRPGATQADLPDLPKPGRYFGESWTQGETRTANYGVTSKAALGRGLSLRAGVFHSVSNRLTNYTVIYSQAAGSSLVSHRLIADPRQDVHSTSGEAQLAWRIDGGRWQHRLIAGYRYRNRYTETGGSAVLTGNQVTYGEADPLAKPAFAFNPVNAGRVTQGSFLLGYTGKLAGVGLINLGLQKSRFRGTSRDGRTGKVFTSRDDPWLYNASLGLDLTKTISVYVGTEKGLEDSGTAPESALNRNEQLPPTRSTQYEAGVRWKFSGGQWVVNAFQITKPYFSFDGAGNFVQLGEVRHRGIETSLSGHFGKRLSVVAGALAMKPRVSTGGRPVGTPSLFARADINYRTDILGLTATAAVVHTGSRLASPTLEIPGYTTVDLGVRRQFKIGSTAASIRAVAQNVFDAASWKVVAANTLYPEERRRFTISLSADF